MSKGQINQIIIMYSVKGLNKGGSGTINRLTNLKPHNSPLHFILIKLKFRRVGYFSFCLTTEGEPKTTGSINTNLPGFPAPNIT